VLDENAVPTPRYFVADAKTESVEDIAAGLGYPLIAKPLREGGHIGIEEDSIVHNPTELKRAVQRVLDNYDQPALVEMYITGAEMREFSVGIIDGELALATPVEIDYAAMGVETKILSFTAAQRDLERIKLVDDETTRQEIVDLSRKTFSAVGAFDYGGVDLRMNRDGCYVLEINIMPGLGPHSFLPEAARMIYGLGYARLIQKLAQDSMNRQDCLA
jgi:D-alanine-D-alanine ligase